MDRRNFLNVACTALVCSVCGAGSGVARQNRETALGCIASESYVRGLSVHDNLRGFSSLNMRQLPIVAGSGNDNLDRALGHVLVDMSATFGQRPGFAYYEDGQQPNALATTFTKFPRTRGTVLFGLSLIERQLAAHRHGDIAVLAICAHEFAHILQFDNNGQILKSIESAFPRYCVELHADFLAGFYLNRYHRIRPSINISAVGSAWSRLGSSNFNRPGSHGTSRQRVFCIEAGYEFANGVPDADVFRAARACFEVLQRAVGMV